MNMFYGTHREGTHVNEGGKTKFVEPLELIPFRLRVSVLCYTVSPAGWNKTATPPTLFLIRICPSLHSAFHSASSCLWASFHDLFPQPSEISHINHSRHTIRLTTQTLNLTLPRKTDTREGDVALLTCGLWTSTVFTPRRAWHCQSWNINSLNIDGLYLQFYTGVQPSADGSSEIVS